MLALPRHRHMQTKLCPWPADFDGRSVARRSAAARYQMSALMRVGVR